MKKAVLFDLGNTLVRYFDRDELPAILKAAITEVRDHLAADGLLTVPPELMWERVRKEDHGSPGDRVYPLEDRLGRIFGLVEPGASEPLTDALCRAFMKPIFALAHVYEDVVPTLDRLRTAGLRTAIVSNTPWGSPAGLWREELERLGLAGRIDEIVLCGDVGWRKPDRRIFEFVLGKMQAQPADCLFVGDHPRWDVEGPSAVGIDAILIDRTGSCPANGTVIHDLQEVLAMARA
ncbi:MAG: HAD family hydrolase [Planctomycetota bacterium]|jgi:putative hydrolase of the HAD superfamily